METSVKRIDDMFVELTITIDADTVTKKIGEVYKEAGKVRIPGFRPGKAPRHVLDNNYGGKEYFGASAAEHFLETTTPLAVDKEGFIPLGSPNYNKFDYAEEGKPFIYVFTIKVLPEFELSSYEPVQIELPSVEPTEEDIQRDINAMLDYYVEYEEVTDRGAQQGDSLLIVLEDILGGSPEDGSNELPYDLGSNVLPADFENALIGMKPGETKEVEIALGESRGEDDDTNAAPESMTARITVKTIRLKHLPDLTDAWVKSTLAYEGVDEFKTRIAAAIKENKQEEMNSLKEILVAQKLLDRLKGEPPQEMVQQTERDNYQDLFRTLQYRGMTFDQHLASIGLTQEAFNEQMTVRAKENATIALALGAFARHLGFTVSEEEIAEEFKNTGVEDPAVLHQEWIEAGRLSEVREGLMRMKAARHLEETAEVFAPGELKKEDKAEAKKTTAKKPATEKKETTAKKPAAKKADVDKEGATEKKPAAKKTTAKKPATKKEAAE